MKNRMILKISAIGENEGFARSAVAAFAAAMEPTIDELSDLKTAVSEAVTNCVVHAYKGAESEENYITITCEADENARVLHIEVADTGCGIENVEEALQPFFTTSGSACRYISRMEASPIFFCASAFFSIASASARPLARIHSASCSI